MKDLGTFPGGSDSQAFGINDSGQVAGRAFVDGTYHAFLCSGGVMSDLGTLGGTWSQAGGINKSGQVVGLSWTAGNAAEHAFVYRGGVMSDLNNDIRSGLGWTLEDALGINDNDQIVGYGTNPSGQMDAFLLTPIPEPGLLALLLLGGATMLFRRGGPSLQ